MNSHFLSRLLSRVLFLGRSPSPGGDHSSVRLPETLGEQPVTPPFVLLRVGFTCNRLSPAARWSLTPPFHPYLCPKAIGGLLSAALASGSLRLGFPKHSALWSPDFPRQHMGYCRDRLAYSAFVKIVCHSWARRSLSTPTAQPTPSSYRPPPATCFCAPSVEHSTSNPSSV